MKGKGATCLLILLLSSACLDDAWAAATVDPLDDAQAAGNNEYLHFTASRREDRPRRNNLRPPCVAVAPPVASPGTAHARDNPGVQPTASLVTPLLYVFMSLQR
jgi:hypothetical protein